MIRSIMFGTMALALLAAVPAGARNDDPAENRGYYGNLPACDSPAVLGEISYSFSQRETYFASSTLAIATYERVGQLGLRPWGANFIPRRFCTARAQFSDGHVRQVDYSVRDGLGLFGWTWNVNRCVQGLDRHWTYQADCTMARP
jgi:hypothetical protein